MKVEFACFGFKRPDALILSDEITNSEELTGSQVTTKGASGIGTGVVELIIVGTVAGTAIAGWLANRIYQIRQRFRPLIVIDAAGADIKVEVREDIPGMRGEVIFRSSDGSEVRIESPDELNNVEDALARLLDVI